MVDPFGWHQIDQATLHDIREKLAHFESRTWNEILVVSKDRNHTVEVSKLCVEARKRLISMKLDDVEEVVSLRLAGAERVWGLRQKGTLLLLWWDPLHEIYPTPKKGS